VSAILGGGAFALAVAGPMQWDPCPAHGATQHGAMAPGQAGALSDAHAMSAHSHEMADHSTGTPRHAPGKHDGTHQCTCPGCACCSAQVVLGAGAAPARLEFDVLVRDRIAPSESAVTLSPSPQVVLPFPNAPPADRT
jgi:hypothetical protein